MSASLFEFLLRLGDDRLILGHRNAEWCGHGPILEEDIAITNIALDLTGAAQLLLDLAGRVEGQGRDADALAYWRDETQFRNLQMVELPRGDFAFTMVRQLFFSAWTHFHFEWLKGSAHEELAGIAAKAQKENRYHLRHAGEWVVRLGDGTEESHRRAQEAVDALWPWTDEMFATDAVDQAAEAELGLPARPDLKAEWRAVVLEVLGRARLTVPEAPMRMTGGRKGRHTESLGPLLAEMQIVPRSHPGATW
ncbi:MAG: phenylacetate-CoA oxygenase subunit PaaC [Gemmatimonadales bacterium]|nr:phenylacetate-CoA oxygenase subunit PaaC [Gemmatimonadales bacterium]